MEEIMWGRESLEQDEQALEESRKVLEGGGVIVFPTDTIYGLGAKAVDEAAIRHVYRIKGREEGKPVSILVRDMKMARRVACIDSRAEQILEKVWPGSVTVVLRKKDLIPYALTAGGESVAVRISDHPFVEALFGRSIFRSLRPARIFQKTRSLFGGRNPKRISRCEKRPRSFYKRRRPQAAASFHDYRPYGCQQSAALAHGGGRKGQAW
jgi:hypothetical protein